MTQKGQRVAVSDGKTLSDLSHGQLVDGFPLSGCDRLNREPRAALEEHHVFERGFLLEGSRVTCSGKT